MQNFAKLSLEEKLLDAQVVPFHAEVLAKLKDTQGLDYTVTSHLPQCWQHSLFMNDEVAVKVVWRLWRPAALV